MIIDWPCVIEIDFHLSVCVFYRFISVIFRKAIIVITSHWPP